MKRQDLGKLGVWGVKGGGRREGRGKEVFSLGGKIVEPDGKTRSSEIVGTSIVN